MLTSGTANSSAKLAAPGDVSSEMQQLGMMTETLRDVVKHLEDRISPILERVSEGNESKSGHPEPPLSPLASTIKDNRYSIANSVEMIQSIINRVQL